MKTSCGNFLKRLAKEQANILPKWKGLLDIGFFYLLTSILGVQEVVVCDDILSTEHAHMLLFAIN